MLRWIVPFVAIAGCAHHGVVDDGTSVSYGKGNKGALHTGVKLPLTGDGYWVPPRWKRRGNIYGTDELVALVVRVGRRMQRELPGVQPFGVADLSPRVGGPSRFHRSHQSGRDVDVLFYYMDESGKSLKSSWMKRVDEYGATVDGLRFDVERNWALVRALIEERSVEVQYIFVYEPLKHLLLEHAISAGEPNGLVEHAAYLLHQPGDSAPHNDHFHVRIYCPPSDRPLGCRDRGVLRWKKKAYKYELITAAVTMATRSPVSAPLVAVAPSRLLRAWSLLLPMPFQYRLRTLATR